jgi:hypothetical protein
MKPIKISEATDEQLRKFATDVQQIENVPTERGRIIAALVESGHESDFIFVEGDASPDQDEPVEQFAEPEETVHKMPTAGFGYWKNSPMVRLKILPTDRPGGNEPAHPSINGSPPLVIARNKLVEIPWDFYLVLKQAGGTKLVSGALPTDDLVKLDYSEYPMTDVVLPSRDAIAKWQARTGDNELGRPKAQAA